MITLKMGTEEANRLYNSLKTLHETCESQAEEEGTDGDPESAASYQEEADIYADFINQLEEQGIHGS